MEEGVVYSKRGGGYTSAINTKAMGGRATWPFAKLVLRQDNLTFSLLSNRIDLQFSEIQQVGVTKTGYVVIQAKDPLKSFGFTWIGLPKIVSHLRSAGVPTDDTATTNLSTANTFITGQLVFMVAFLALFVLLFLGGSLHLGPLSHLKYRK